MQKGLLLSLLTIFLWALYDVFVRFAGSAWHVKPFVFIAYTNLVAALTLILAAGPGKLASETVKQPQTWVFSVINILMDTLFVFIVLLISATEANFMIRFSIVVSLVMAWMFFARKPTKHDALGSMAILGGLGLIVENIAPAVRIQAILLLLLITLCQTLRTVIAERHPTARQTEGIRDRARVTGYVLLVTSFSFLAAGFMGAFLKSLGGEEQGVAGVLLNSLPSLGDFTHPATLLAATVLGIFNVSVSNYFYFYAARLTKSETFLMVSAALPLFTYPMEYAAHSLGLLDISSIHPGDLLAGGLITAGAMYMVYMRHVHALMPAVKARRVKAQKQAEEASLSDYAMVSETLLFCEGSTKEAARLLDIPQTEIAAIHKAKGGRRLSGKNGMQVARRYQRYVASADFLTKVSNRATFLNALQGVVRSQTPAVLLYMDLNKFKPVNDAYGHEAGDAVLKEVGRLLRSLAPETAVVARLGGDEFAVLLRKCTEWEAGTVRQKMAETLALPLNVSVREKKLVLDIGVSIGTAVFPKDALTPEELLALADKRMYNAKKHKDR